MDPLNHSRVPMHIILTQKEAEAELGALRSRLPGLLVTDPALRSAAERQGIEEIEIGSVVKILRKSRTGGEDTPYFRIVIPAIR